mgnify:CR=1 FL=1
MKIEIRNVTVERPGGIRALERISWTFDTGDCAAIAILGANGAGKSTLLESVLGLVPVAAGTIHVDGLEAAKKNWTEIRRKIGMIFQNSDDQLFAQTVRDDVAFGPANLHLPPETVAERVAAALALLEITHLAERDVTRLSGGEKRRVALAGVLAMQPEAILLDEPTSMLDPRTCRELAEYLKTLPALKIIATHDLAFARRVCTDGLILKDGQVFASGRLDALLERHDMLFACGLE